MKWIRIHIEGMVQGVGFRPFVYKLAHWLNLKGWVCNGVDGVHIEAGGTPEQIEMFKYLLNDDAPQESTITRFSSEEIEAQEADDFQIVESHVLGSPTLLITPDLGLCEHCRKEIHDPHNRRYNYPFTTCTHCGPRYSIIQSLPYDRPLTSMSVFKMCDACKTEYNNPLDRRHFAQTNSCPDCPIPIRLLNNQGVQLAYSWSDALEQLVDRVKAGEIAAVKGIGGYLLIADATNETAIRKLRERKHRPSKPFALMYPDLETLEGDVQLSEAEKSAFKSIQCPIVLARIKDEPVSGICVNDIAPGLEHIGAMQPYTALFDLLLKAFGKPMIATSGNAGGSPILFEDAKALENLKEIADVFLVNDREIQIAQDDSVVRFTKRNQRIVIRRSRGYAPNFINNFFGSQKDCVLAMGADMKSSFAIQVKGRVYTSQYLGDLESYESQESFRKALSHMLDLLRVKPERIVLDPHPNYFSSRLGIELAHQWEIPVEEVQHHKAHAYAVLAENDRLHDPTPVLCVVWDGTGFGDDRQIWGGEFFAYENHQLERVVHFNNFPVWQGDLMVRQPRLSALYLCKDFLSDTDLQSHFSEQEWNYYSKLVETRPPVQTSSVGRLFDAVAALLGLCTHNTFEGEASMLLETLAATGRCEEHYRVHWRSDNIDERDLIRWIITDLKHHVNKDEIAFKFHAYLANVISEVMHKYKFHQVALSGGVFQNALLVELIWEKLHQHNRIFTHHELSPNDENIAVGQLACIALAKKKENLALSFAVNLN
ncbi:MAG: carbamoyltransferase HypF [Cyclobacteriaceae bacterium]